MTEYKTTEGHEIKIGEYYETRDGDIMRPWVDKVIKSDNNTDYENQSVKQLMQNIINGSTEEEFKKHMADIISAKMDECMDVLIKTNSKAWEDELKKYAEKTTIALQALNAILSTKNMTLQQREQLPYNWKIAEIALTEMVKIK